MTERSEAEVLAVKRQARLLSRAVGITHRQALDAIANKAGHNHWGPYLSTLKAGSVKPGWRVDGTFSSYPPLIGAVLERPDVNTLTINADGSAWIDRGTPEETSWSRLAPNEIDSQDDIRTFMDTIHDSMKHANGLTFIVAGSSQDHHDHRLTARANKGRGKGFDIAIRRGPRKDDPRLDSISDWGMAPDWHVHILASQGAATDDIACSIAVHGKPASARLITFRVKAKAKRHPNRVEAYSNAYDERSSIDIGMRLSGDAFVMRADTPTRAVAGLQMAYSNHGPTVLIVDADPDEAVKVLTRLADAGNVDPNRNVREGLDAMIAQLPERHTIHVGPMRA